MVASRQVEISSFRGTGQYRGRRLSALAQVTGRSAIPFLRYYVVPAAKLEGVDLLESAGPETAVVVSGRKIFKTAAISVGRETLRQQLGSGSRKKSASRFIPLKSANEPVVGQEGTVIRTYIINHVD